MEGRSVLRRAQSLRSVSMGDGDKPAWAEAGFRDRMKSISVSQMLTRYQASPSVEVPTLNHVEHKTEQITKHQTSFSTVREKTKRQLAESAQERKLESLMRNNGVREMTRIQPSVSEVREKTRGSTSLLGETSRGSASLLGEKSQRSTNLSRSKSMSSLPGPSPRIDPAGSIRALKALFESKVTKEKVKSIMGAVGQTPSRPKMAAAAPAINGLVEERKGPIEEKAVPSPASPAREEVTTQVGRMMRSDRRKTISGINLEKISTASQDDDKRKSISDLSDAGSSSFSPEREKPSASVSVRAISALYLSKVAAAESTAQDPSSPTKRGVKPSKFLPCKQDVCSSCLKPVYPMEKMTADKFTFHKNCFCCKHCQKKLSMHSYAPLYGEFYCVFHYQQLFRRKGNYDEGFGHTQHKDRWLQRTNETPGSNSADVI
ncbi:LIM domain and actin-binding protein 1-like isoform X1 [Oncorhynchus tshawytscha]|uniref:LIM domain and actin-binding protein 1-like isoform X1 n=1 Tax=Oncorhynchus tshawytscha TaxID=74940 RepID=UPI001C3E053C|nr:LIM domain and actin-binding protein 1-like isoform X1 [Oncorhynchus tshawytscha]XP_042164820.1 LIM domain and actin-binding protein 1-like isoform X1 [Oncorhynchus tshawytscha]XP_042164821.1 LIM domain and actin-binding protein 1-like isoform X1 [Oncorhynchus tshawytscha]